MPKATSFADKMSKKAEVKICPECGGPVENVLLVDSNCNNPKGTLRFREHFVGVCKCNHKEIYG